MKKTLKITLNYMRILAEYFFVLLIILECNSVYRCLSDRIDIIYKLQRGAIVAGISLILIWLIGKIELLEVITNASILLCGIFAFEVLFLLFNARLAIGLENYIYSFMIFLPISIILFQIYKKCDLHFLLFYRLTDIVLLLAVASLVLWLFSNIISILEPLGQISVDWGNRHNVDNYYYLFFPWIEQDEYISFLNKNIIRNIGIFTETPMYNIFLCSALYTELFLKKKTKFYRIVILVMTIISTFGTIGIVVAICGLFFRYSVFILEKSKSKWLIILPSIFVVILALGLFFNKQIHGSSSFSVHIQDYIVTLKAWYAQPIFGCGYDNVSTIASFMPPERNNYGLSNSIGTVLAQGGIVLSVFCLLPFILLLKKIFEPEKRNIALWAFGMFLLYATTIFHFRFYLMLLFAFGFSFINLPINYYKFVKHFNK